MRKQKGISLIVLVITIIVMIILAGSIILTLSNNGIIGKASDAVEGSNEGQLKHAVQLAWADAYVEYGANIDELKKAVDKTIEDNKFDISEYGILVTTSGVKVIKGWVQDGLEVRKGYTKLNIGDYVDYDEKPTENSLTDVQWQVLGASDSGELLILSNKAVTNIDLLSDNSTYATDKIQKLNILCEPYRNGKSATGARSINVEDVNKITGYDPKKEAYKGQDYEYGNIITYTWTEEGNIKYVSTNGHSGMWSGEVGLLYYNGTAWEYARNGVPKIA